MHWNDLVGHQKQIEAFRRAASRDRLSHALLFVGPAGIGKQTFARLLAQSLFCDQHPDSDLNFCGECSNCKQFAAKSHPDFFSIGLPEGKSEIPIDLFIGPPERRGQAGLCHDISLKPMSARRKIALIDDANRLNEASGNALLKTLEEPPEKSILILVAEKEERILTTIRSRCQMVRFTPLQESELTQLMVRTGLVDSEEKAAQYAPYCDGSLRTANEFIQHDWLTLRRQVFSVLKQRDFNWVQIAQKMIEMVESIASDNLGQRLATAWIVRFVQEYCREALAEQVAAAPVGMGSSDIDLRLKQLQKMYDRSLKAQQHLDQFLSVGNVIEGLFDDLSRLKRASV